MKKSDGCHGNQNCKLASAVIFVRNGFYNLPNSPTQESSVGPFAHSNTNKFTRALGLIKNGDISLVADTDDTPTLCK